jgi:diguanylate cyclase
MLKFPAKHIAAAAETEANELSLREQALRTREAALKVREQTAASLETALAESLSTKAALDNHVNQLRKANEQLVITTVQTQTVIEQVEQTKNQLAHMAHYDFLTDLPNRALLRERISQSRALAKRYRKMMAILFMDLDKFKSINDTLGHAVGDLLLRAVAKRLLASVRASDTVSRQGGDEFIVLLSEVADEKGASVIAGKIHAALTAPYDIGEEQLQIGVTIGISMYPDDDEDPETLIRNADMAMYHAKGRNANRWQFFREDMNSRAIERQRTEADLYLALERQEFELYYQAQVEIETGRINGAEALIRWHHPSRGMLFPSVFVPIAEASGAMIPIGRWVMREACRQTRQWLDAGLKLDVITVNISALEFVGAEFLDSTQAVLRDTRLAPHNLEVELTETALMRDGESTSSMLHKLKTIGARVAVDDFGTGYSNLSYLKKFPIDTLKIDQSFVAGIASNRDDEILVAAMIGLGKSLGHNVVAEGVETPSQLAFLRQNNCARAQGYYLSRPMSAGEFSALAKTGSIAAPADTSSAAGLRS